jgi:hypothetical protein
MTDVEQLLSEYKEAHRSGGDADPRPILERAPRGVERELLAGLIDAFLSRAERRPVGAAPPVAAEAVVDEVHRSLAGAAGLWPALLPRLRGRARLRRAELVSELAARLGAQSRQDKVGLYYHQMEQGLLPAAGVSDTVLEALGRVVGVAADSLRKAGSMPSPGPPRMDDAAVFARTADAPPADPGAAETSGPPLPSAGEWDEVDRLFRGS